MWWEEILILLMHYQHRIPMIKYLWMVWYLKAFSSWTMIMVKLEGNVFRGQWLRRATETKLFSRQTIMARMLYYTPPPKYVNNPSYLLFVLLRTSLQFSLPIKSFIKVGLTIFLDWLGIKNSKIKKMSVIGECTKRII